MGVAIRPSAEGDAAQCDQVGDPAAQVVVHPPEVSGGLDLGPRRGGSPYRAAALAPAIRRWSLRRQPGDGFGQLAGHTREHGVGMGVVRCPHDAIGPAQR